MTTMPPGSSNDPRTTPSPATNSSRPGTPDAAARNQARQVRDAQRPDAQRPGSRSRDAHDRDTQPLRDDLNATVDDARSKAAGRVDDVAASADAAAAQLERDDMSRLSGYVHEMASALSGVAGDLRTRSGDDMLKQVSQLARRNPALFLGGAVAIGFGLSRFARASRSHGRSLPVPADEARADIGGH